MPRMSDTSAGFARLMRLTVRWGERTGTVWSPAPIELEAELTPVVSLPPRRREVVWVAMDDQRLWLAVIDVRTGDALAATPTEQRCGP